MLAKVAAQAVVVSLGVTLLATASLPAVSSDDDEARARVACAGGKAELRVKAESDDDDDSGALRVELRVDTRRPFASWRIVLLHERMLVFNRVRRTIGSHRRLRLRLTLPDWPGREMVTARLTTRDRRTCRLGVTI